MTTEGRYWLEVDPSLRRGRDARDGYRPYFRFDRRLLGKLSQCAYQCLKEFFRKTLNKEEGVPGAVISIQTFGDLVNFHPHLHCLVTDGCFLPNGWFYVLPEIDVKKLEMLFGLTP